MNSPASNAKDDHRNTVGEWLKRRVVWRIPVYQRHYAWDSKKESGPIHLFWETVEEQTIARLNDQKPPQHYLGAMLVDDKTVRGATDDIKHWDVVDGQQRLTTIQIALLALIRVAAKHKCDFRMELEEFVYSDGKERNQPCLHPTNFDYEQFRAVLHQAYDAIWTRPNAPAMSEIADQSKIDTAFGFFQSKYQLLVKKHSQSKSEESIDVISADATRHEPHDVFRAIMQTLTSGLDFVLIVLRQSDEAQRIFESLNNYAEPLTTFDLIRNNVFYRAAKVDMDEKLFGQDNWQQLEYPYWKRKADRSKTRGNTHIEAYIARMLVAKMRKEFRFSDRADIFKTYKEFHKKFSSIEEEIKGLVDYVDIYRYLDGDTEKNPVVPEVDFGVFLHGIWPNRDLYPVIFLIAGSSASALQKQRMIRLLECYVIRRGVCGLPHTHAPYNKLAITICKELGNNPNYEALRKVLKAAKEDTSVFPEDERVKVSCISAKFYPSPFQQYVFERIEKSLHDLQVEKVDVTEGQLTVDHILPQGWEQNEKWKSMMLGTSGNRGEEAVMVVNAYLHTIGNLTMMSGSNNSAKSNRPWGEVKKMLSDSNMRLNRQLAEEESWGLEKIRARSERLAEKICEIWPYDIPDDDAQ